MYTTGTFAACARSISPIDQRHDVLAALDVEAAVRVGEVVLHVDDDERRAREVLDLVHVEPPSSFCRRHKLRLCGDGRQAAAAAEGVSRRRVSLSVESNAMPYQSLYRKHRPQTFGGLVGQDHVTGALRNAVREGRVGHAYLFSGPRGTGKTTTARILAKALNCLNLGADGEPCGVCENCVAIAEGRFLDLFELDAASNNSVDNIRDLTDSVHLGLGATSKRKVYLVDEVQMLSAAASNALLKTLEEPPEHVVFVLATTNPEKVLPTIRSRTQHLEFTLFSAEELEALLADVLAQEGIEADPEALAVIARAGAGSARDALSLLDQALAHGTERLDAGAVSDLFGGTPFELRAAVLDAVAAEDPAGVLVAVGALLDAGHEPRRIAEDVLRSVRDAFLLNASGGQVRVDAPEDEQRRLDELGHTLGQHHARAGARDARPSRGRHARHRRRRSAPRARDRARPAHAPGGRAAAPDRDGTHREARADRGRPARRRSRSAPGAARADGSPRTGGHGRRAAQAPSPSLHPPPTRRPKWRPRRPTPRRPRPSARASRRKRRRRRPSTSTTSSWRGRRCSPSCRWRRASAVQEAQPLSVEGDVVTFGVSPRLIEAARPRFRREADTIRDALSQQVGTSLRFNLVAHEGFSGERTASAQPAPPVAEPEEHDDIVIEPDESTAPPGVESGSPTNMLTESLGATVVEERHHE